MFGSMERGRERGMNDDDIWVNKYFTPNPPFQPLEAFPCSVLSLFYYKHEGIPVATGR